PGNRTPTVASASAATAVLSVLAARWLRPTGTILASVVARWRNAGAVTGRPAFSSSPDVADEPHDLVRGLDDVQHMHAATHHVEELDLGLRLASRWTLDRARLARVLEVPGGRERGDHVVHEGRLQVRGQTPGHVGLPVAPLGRAGKPAREVLHAVAHRSQAARGEPDGGIERCGDRRRRHDLGEELGLRETAEADDRRDERSAPFEPPVRLAGHGSNASTSVVARAFWTAGTPCTPPNGRYPLAMFQSLGDRLQSVIGGLRGRGRLSEADVKAALREVRVALLEADVNLEVARDFAKRVQEKAVGSEVLTSLQPDQRVIAIVHEELVDTLGGKSVQPVLKSESNVWLLM